MQSSSFSAHGHAPVPLYDNPRSVRPRVSTHATLKPLTTRLQPNGQSGYLRHQPGPPAEGTQPAVVAPPPPKSTDSTEDQLADGESAHSGVRRRQRTHRRAVAGQVHPESISPVSVQATPSTQQGDQHFILWPSAAGKSQSTSMGAQLPDITAAVHSIQAATHWAQVQAVLLDSWQTVQHMHAQGHRQFTPSMNSSQPATAPVQHMPPAVAHTPLQSQQAHAEEEAGSGGTTPPLVLLEHAMLQVAALGPDQGPPDRFSPGLHAFGKQLTAWLQAASASRQLSHLLDTTASRDLIPASETLALNPAVGEQQGTAIASAARVELSMRQQKLHGTRDIGSTSSTASALTACAESNSEAAVRVVEAMGTLGKPFVIRRYIKRVVSLCHSRGFHALSPVLLSRLLSACSKVGYPMSKAQLQSAAAALQAQHTQSDSAAALTGLCALLRYALLHPWLAQSLLKGDSQATTTGASQSLPTQAALHPATDPLPHSDPQAALDQQAVAQGPLAHSSSLVNNVCCYIQDQLHFQGVTVSHLIQLLSLLHQHNAHLPSAWLDPCLTHAVTQSRQLSQPEDKRQAMAHQHHQHQGQGQLLSEAQAVVGLVMVLSVLRYQPPLVCVEAMLGVMQAAMLAPASLPGIMSGLRPGARSLLSSSAPQHTSSQLPAPEQQQPVWLSAQDVAAAALSMVALELQAGPVWCARAMACVLSSPLAGACGSGCRLMGCLPALLGPAAVRRSGWVGEQLPLLEQLTSSVSGYLAAATAAELTTFITGCAGLRYHPGHQFLQWHASRCQALRVKFPPDQLIQVQGAYSSLGFQPPSLLAAAMNRALKTLLEEQRSQEHRAAAAVEVVRAQQQPQGPTSGARSVAPVKQRRSRMSHIQLKRMAEGRRRG